MIWKFFRKEKVFDEHILDKNKELPKHLAVIMDGNGRWAKQRHLPRVYGHKEGMNTVKKITKCASNLGIKVLTMYAFSTENWRRPEDEVSFLMQLPIDFFDTFVPELIEQNVKVMVIGDITRLPDKTQEAVFNAMDQTKHNTGMILNFALNYGSRLEITNSIQEIARKVEQGLAVEDIDEDLVSRTLGTAKLGAYQDPDLLIRTSGEARISNFLLWQIAYSELYFTDVLWPDFDEQELIKALVSYQGRKRRFGGLNKEENK